MTQAPDVTFADNACKAFNAAPKPAPLPPVASFAGWNIHLSHTGTSFSCPGLSMFGYSTQRQLVGAMKRRGYGVNAKVAKPYID